MKICFFNTNHIGDIYFSSFFIRRICQLNPEIDFYYYCIQGDIFFQGVSNIRRIDQISNEYNNELINGEPPEQLIDNSILSFILQNIGASTKSKIENYNNEEILFINTWCFANGHKDFDFISANNCWSNIIERINNEYGFILKYDCAAYKDLIYDIPVDDFHIENYSIDYDNTVFIFNYKPRSLDFNYTKLQDYIFTISKNKKVILSAYDSIFSDNANIQFIDRDFMLYPPPCCSNVVKLWKIAKKCHKVVLLPSGSTWIFFHELGDLRMDQIYIFNSYSYCETLNKMIYLIDPENKTVIQNI